MLFLHGGGDAPQARRDTFGRFVEAATIDESCRVALVVAENTEAQARASFEEYRAIFAALPLAPSDIHPVLISAEQPLARAHLERIQPTGVFVCGGNTPLYQQALCRDTAWLAHLQMAKIPYGGTSTGAAIAARTAIVGGWQASTILSAQAGQPIDTTGWDAAGTNFNPSSNRINCTAGVNQVLDNPNANAWLNPAACLASALMGEGEEILSIVVASIKTARRNK